MSRAPRFTGAVLTGGASQRMGTDKSLLEIEGRPLSAIVAAALRGAAAIEVLAVGGDARALESTGAFDRIVADEHPGEGPLAGILTALDASIEEIVVVLACDTPGVGPAAPRSLVDALIAADADVAMAMVDARRQPLTAAWRRSRCADRLRAEFDRGERAPRRALDSLTVVEVTDLPPSTVDDLDRPEDVARYAASVSDRSSGPLNGASS